MKKPQTEAVDVRTPEEKEITRLRDVISYLGSTIAAQTFRVSVARRALQVGSTYNPMKFQK